MEIKTKISKWDSIKLKKLLHSKGNHKQTTHRMGDNICKWFQTRDWPPNLQTAHITQYKRKTNKWFPTVVQWFRFCASTSGCMGWGSSACHKVWPKNPKQTNQKSGRPIHTFLQRRHTDSQVGHEKMLNTANYSVQFSCSVVPDSLWAHEPPHTRPPCPSPTPGDHPNPCTLSWWCHPTISSSVILFSSCPQSLPASGSFQMSQLFASVGQSTGVSASTSVLPMNTQDWSPLGWTANY